MRALVCQKISALTDSNGISGSAQGVPLGKLAICRDRVLKVVERHGTTQSENDVEHAIVLWARTEINKTPNSACASHEKEDGPSKFSNSPTTKDTKDSLKDEEIDRSWFLRCGYRRNVLSSTEGMIR